MRRELLGDVTHVVVAIGRLMPQKGIDILIDCVARMKRSHPRLRFVRAVPVGGLPVICDAVAGVLGGEDMRRTMGRAALPGAGEDRFRPDRVNEQFLGRYRRLKTG